MNEKFILSLMDKFDSAEITEFDFNDGSHRLVMRKGIFSGPQNDAANKAAEANADSTVSGGSGKTVHLGIPAGTSPDKTGGAEKIKSPIVATYYAAVSPDAPAFVSSGSKVKTGQTLCILEAMKMMNHLEAEFDCEIIDIHSANGDLVEYDQPLFTVKRL